MTATQPNLLPASVIKRRYVAARFKAWMLIWLLTTVVTVYSCFVQRRRVADMQDDAVRLAAASAPLKDLRAEHQSVQLQVESIRKRESWLTDSDSSQTLQLLGFISRAAAQNNGRINVQTMELMAIERVVETADKAPNKKADRTHIAAREQRMQLDLSGIAVDDLAVASFTANLREAGVFESVELKSSLSQIFNNHETRLYEVTCVY